MAAIANRLKRFIATYVNADQTGFILGRDIADNVRHTLNIILTGMDRPELSLITAIDIEKVFSMVEVPYLETLLSAMGFVTGFLQIIHSLCDSSTSNILINGSRSPDVQPRKGTRQSCPLSPLLFALSIEPLAIAIRKEEAIHGVFINNKKHKVSLFAEDMAVFVHDTAASLPQLQTLLSVFGPVSELKVNMAKTERYPIKLSNGERAIISSVLAPKWVLES